MKGCSHNRNGGKADKLEPLLRQIEEEADADALLRKALVVRFKLFCKYDKDVLLLY